MSGNFQIRGLHSVFTGTASSFANFIPQDITGDAVTVERHFLGFGKTKGDGLAGRCSVLTNPGRELRGASPIHGVFGVMWQDAVYPDSPKIFPLIHSVASEDDLRQGIERFVIQDPQRTGEEGRNTLSVVLASARGMAAPGSNTLLIELKGSFAVGGVVQEALVSDGTYRVASAPSNISRGGVNADSVLVKGGVVYMPPQPV